MNQPLEVVICGQSIIWAAVEAALNRLPNVNITHYDSTDLWSVLIGSAVDVILFDSRETIPPALFTNRESGPALLKLDFGSRNLAEPLFNPARHPELEALLAAIQGQAGQTVATVMLPPKTESI